MWRNASKYYVTLHQVPPASHASHRCSTHSDLLYFFAQISPTVKIIDWSWKKLQNKPASLPWCIVSSSRMDFLPHRCHVIIIRRSHIVFHSSSWRRRMSSGWGLTCIWSLERVVSGRVVVSRVMKPGTIWTLASASSVGSGHSDASQHPVSTRCITTL